MPDWLDLGDLELPVLVFGGPYGNLQTTEAMRAEARRRGIPARRTICTGDIVAYCGDPAATVGLIRDWGVPVVMGNVDEQIGAGAADCGCGFAEGSACAELSRDWFAYAQAALDRETAEWMGARPHVIRFRVGGLQAAAIHGGAEVVNQFVFASTPADEKARQMAMLGVDLVVAGHSGLPFTQEIAGGLWHNAGVIGMPANDGTRDGWFSLIVEDDGGLAVVHRRLPYDHAGAAAAMRRNALPEAYATALETGLWPNMDILPEAERARQGRSLRPATVCRQRFR